MNTTTIVIVWGAIALALVISYIVFLVLRRRRINRQRQMELFDSAMRSRWNRKG